MQTFKDRLIFLFGNNAGPTKIAKDIDMTYQGFTRVWYGNGIPKAETLIKIKERTGCDLNWLLTGVGEPFSNTQSQTSLDSTKTLGTPNKTAYNSLKRPVDIDEFVFIPRYEVEATAGHGAFIDHEDSIMTIAFRKFWIDCILHASPKDLSVIRVKGDSMEPELYEGDSILINHAKTQPEDGLFVLRIGETLLVKRIQVMPAFKLKITSANPVYEDFIADLSNPADGVAIIGKVEWVCRRI